MYQRDYYNWKVSDLVSACHKDIVDIMKENSIVYKDLFDTKIMGCLVARPSEIRARFKDLYDFIDRMSGQGVNKRYMENLIKESYTLEIKDIKAHSFYISCFLRIDNHHFISSSGDNTIKVIVYIIF